MTGVPGTGKTTVSGILAVMGYSVCDAAEIAASSGCLKGGEVDIGCLRSKGHFSECDAVQSHFSHLLDCTIAVILETEASVLEQRMVRRGYSGDKIRENIDAQLSGTLYYEALEHLPSGRIHVIDTTDTKPDSVADQISRLIESDRKK
ncbi:MAG TPA: adenylate kinase family protein [Thermoplasmataceae archaeon]|nr:adenylate kinase family protein [Thermoplasmataceae archaeon]